MKFYKTDIVFQEIPGEISLAFYICGCPLRCPGCHSPELWTEKTGKPLTIELFASQLTRYRGLISNVLFLGGEWHQKELIRFLKLAKDEGLHTALYTGLESVPDELRSKLDFLKVGPWWAELGGLSSKTTNQRLYDLRTGQVLNSLFQNETKQQGDTSCL